MADYTDWVEYKCKSGQTLFVYNKVTGEHKWPTDSSKKDDTAMLGEPVIYKEVSSIGVQTDDDGCENGCTSMYVNTSNQDISHIETSPLQEQGVLLAVEDNLDIETEEGNEERSTDMDVIDAMLKVLEETNDNNMNRNKTIASYADSGTNKDNDKNSESELHKEDGNYSGDLTVLTGDNNSGTRDNFVHDLSNEGEQKALKQSKYTEKKPFECFYCKKKFIRKCHLVVHIRTHTGEKAFECSYCKKKFNQKGNMITHIRTHTGEKAFECSYCKKKFNQKATLIGHIRTHTGEKPFECSYCKKKFNHKAYLIRHIRRHTGDLPFECSYCKQKFNEKATLISHIRTHTGEKPFECSFCKLKFPRKDSLTYHIRTVHTGEKPFECSYCKKKFNQKTNLIDHIRTHTGEKPFECSYCTKKFNTKGNLIKHIRTHTGEKHFECSFCKKKTLTHHLRTHTGE